MAVTTTQTNKPINPRGNDQSPKGYNRAALYSGKALDFDGVNDNISITEFVMTSGNKYSFCIYANRDNNGMIWSRNNQFLEISFTSGAVQLRTYDTGWNTYTLIDDVPANEWHQIVVTYDVDGNVWKSYLNGQYVKSVTAAESSQKKINRIGSAGGTFYDGEFANAKIFAVELTAAQVADLYNNPEKVVPTGVDNTALKLWLPMQEGAGTTAYDGSGNGNHGTISGATWTHGIGAPVSQTAVIDWNKGVNSFTYSEDFSNADWITIDVTKVSTSETDYIGGTTAANITWLAGSPRYFYQNIGVSGASTLSFYVKSNGGGNKFRLFGNGTLAMGSDMTATSEWVRYDFEFTGNASQGIGITQASDNSAADLLVCFAQVETNASIGPYIPTLATAQTSPVLLPQGLTTGRDITGVNLFENVRKQGALNLDGNSWAEVHDNASLDIGSTDDLTMELWINRLDTPAQTYSKWFDAGPNLTLNDTNYSMGSITTIDEVFVEWRTSSSGWIYTDTDVTFNKNEWTHLVVTIEMTGVNSSIKTYKNGVLSSTKSQTTERGTGGRTTIGRTRWNAARTMPDQIAQPRIYNRALTAEEVARNYNSGKAIYTNS